MSKLEFLKKILATGLAVMSFVPAVGAVESDDEVEGEPPAKMIGISEEEDNFNKMQARGFVCMSYFQKSAKDFIKEFPRGNVFIDAMKYMFEVFDEEIEPDRLSIKRNLNIIEEYIHRRREDKLVEEIYDRFVVFGVEFTPEKPEFSFPEKIFGMTRPLFVAQFEVDRSNLADGILRIKNFEKIISDKDAEYELRCVLKDGGYNGGVLAVKNKNGEWISFVNNGIKKISQEEIMREASYTIQSEVLSYIKK